MTRVEGGDAVVELVEHGGGCGRCHETGGCGGGLAGLVGGKRRRLRLSNDIGVVAGDCVRLVVDDYAGLRVALVVYLLPVALLVGFAALATHLAGTAASDVTSLAGAGIGFTVAVLLARTYQRRNKRRLDVRMLPDDRSAHGPACSLGGGQQEETQCP
ncbi:MAG: SoxR reducing system RseC family protein [Betaproteobacteria bacterium]|nr:SoxR reducing system RseC family protein [Betaproteobacteria bacterium]